MSQKYLQQMLTPKVKDAQDKFFGRHQEPGPAISNAPDDLGSEEIEFITMRDSFYMATTNETGWPYLQHRGGSAGFLKVLSPTQIGFADYRGNRQLLSTGNVSHDDRVSLFLMDYPTRSRLKILGRARVFSTTDEPELASRLTEPAMEKRTERFFLIDIDSYDWNCTQYITPRFTSGQIAEAVKPLKTRIAELEAEIETLRSKH